MQRPQRRMACGGLERAFDDAVDAGLAGLDRVALIVDRRRRIDEVEDAVDIDMQPRGYVVVEKRNALFAVSSRMLASVPV